MTRRIIVSIDVEEEETRTVDGAMGLIVRHLERRQLPFQLRPDTDIEALGHTVGAHVEDVLNGVTNRYPFGHRDASSS